MSQELSVGLLRRPQGMLGRGVRISGPFTCEFGYNISIQDNVAIGPNCYLEDAGRISIGARTIIGANVRFYTVVVPADVRLRSGTKTLTTAASITIESDCYIGSDVIIHPGKWIPKGSYVRASNVVA